jgi:hypothetical protein
MMLDFGFWFFIPTPRGKGPGHGLKFKSGDEQWRIGAAGGWGYSSKITAGGDNGMRRRLTIRPARRQPISTNGVTLR